MKNVPILLKSIIFMTIMAAAGVVATGYMALEAQNVATISARINATNARAALDFANAKEEVMRARGDMLSNEITTNPSSKAVYTAEMKNALGHFNLHMTDAALLVPDYASQIKDLQERGNLLFSQVCAKSFGAAASGGIAAAQPVLMQGCLDAFVPYQHQMDMVRSMIISSVGIKFSELSKNERRMTWISMIILIASLTVIAFLICYIIRASISQPLNRLNAVMQRLSKEDFAVDVPETDRGDEIGQMAGTVMVFKEAGIEKRNAEQAAKAAQAEIEAERTRNETARAETARTQRQVVEALAGGLDQLAVGDLMFRINQNFEEDYDKLRLDFNKAMDVLQSTMQHITESASGVRSSAGEITQSADDLSRRTEQQAASLEETAAALDEITATVRKSSEGADEASGLAYKAKADAERSGDVVGKTVMAMGEIESSSKKISSIIGVIDEIAFQTNLLALNAGVEAARAGDAGRGFAVVATEVRALAQRSADAAKEIKALIVTSGTQVESGVRLVNETGQALGRIVEQVARLNILITGIANSSKEQATALQEVNSAMNQMDQVTQQNAAMVEQSTAASYALASEAEDLSRLVGQFKIGADVTKPTPKKINNSVKPNLLKEASSAGEQKPVLKAVPKQVKLESPNTVSKIAKQFLQPAADDGDWSEF